VVYRDRGYFGAKSKGYDKTMKRAANEHLLGMSYILRNKGSSQKELEIKSYEVTKKVFKGGKVLVITIRRVNLKMLCTVFCYNLYHLMTSKIKGVL
jgi:IS5 family transposase